MLQEAMDGSAAIYPGMNCMLQGAMDGGAAIYPGTNGMRQGAMDGGAANIQERTACFKEPWMAVQWLMTSLEKNQPLTPDIH